MPSFLKQAKAYGLWDITKLFASTEVAGVEYLREVGICSRSHLGKRNGTAGYTRQ